MAEQYKRTEAADNDETVDAKIITAWLRQITPAYLRDEGWRELNRRRHLQAMSARIFANMHYDKPEQGAERAAFFAGAAFGLLEGLHIADIHELSARLVPDLRPKADETQPVTENATRRAPEELSAQELLATEIGDGNEAAPPAA